MTTTNPQSINAGPSSVIDQNVKPPAAPESVSTAAVSEPSAPDAGSPTATPKDAMKGPFTPISPKDAVKTPTAATKVESAPSQKQNAA